MTEQETKQLIEALNVSRSAELGAIAQYMNHHYEARGIDALTIRDVFRKQAFDEMRHAETLAERIVTLGGIPTLISSQVKRGGTLKDMLESDLELEKRAVKRYKEQIEFAEKLGDTTTRRLLEDILIDEERHADFGDSVL